MGNVVKTRRVITGGGGSGGGGGGSVNSVNSGVDITVDNTDPANPIVNFTGTYQDPITVVANYSALPAVGTVTGEFYWCSASQGTSWLPGSLGGTYYSAGLYYSNGVTWEFMETPYQATQAEVDTGTNTNKFVTPATLASATTVIPSTGTTGDLLSFSTANTPSRIAAVATGYLLGSQGTSTLPAWLQAATLNTSLTTPLLVGSTSASGTLTLSSTSNATKGKLLFGASCFDETNNALGIGTVTPYTGFNNSQLVLTGAGHVYSQFNTGNGSYEGTLLFSRNTALKYSFGMGAAATANFYIYDYAVSRYLFYGVNGNVGLGGISTAPTARVQIAAGTATASTAPLKFTSGTNLTTAEAGAMEYNGTNLFFTRAGTTRESVICANSVNSVSPTSPNITITVVIDGTTYYIAAKTTND